MSQIKSKFDFSRFKIFNFLLHNTIKYFQK